MFQIATPIWRKDKESPDEYVEFRENFSIPDGCGTITLLISADTDISAGLNGQDLPANQYPSHRDRRAYDEIDLTPFVLEGENTLDVLVYWCGSEGFSTYEASDPYLIFEVRAGDEVLCASSAGTLSRLSPAYRSHLCEPISPQLGYTFSACVGTDGKQFCPSRPVDVSPSFYPRPVLHCQRGEPVPGQLVFARAVSSFDPSLRPAEQLQTAVLEGDPAPGADAFYLFDLGAETVGYPSVTLTLAKPTEVLLGWGEHIEDGRCRTAVRNFSARITFPAGTYTFTERFRRIGCRYLELLIPGGADAVSVSVFPTVYPLTDRPLETDSPLRAKIADVCRATLRACMHEHYEDCPWREQSMYVMDSRNQMLAGYAAFGETAFPRAAILLIAGGLSRERGILHLCFPAEPPVTIPSFSLWYFLMVKEYIEYSGDLSILPDVEPTLRVLLDTFSKRMKNGLLLPFEGEWNFIEWTETLDGENAPTDRPDLPLNALYALALRAYADTLSLAGRDGAEYREKADAIAEAIKATFYDETEGLFLTRPGENRFSVLTQALAVLVGAGDAAPGSRIRELLLSNGNERVLPATLSTSVCRFDALLASDPGSMPEVLAAIDREWGAMIDAGCTTFWETSDGAAAFSGAGSLCHGWSAIPIYYYSLEEKRGVS